MHLSPDSIVLWKYGYVKINATLVFTWLLMVLLGGGSYFITKKCRSQVKPSRFQAVFEMIILGIKKQIEEIGVKSSEKYFSFLASLFIFIGLAHLCTLFPFYITPTSSLSTTTALALCVFFAVPFAGITERGWGGYLKSYMKPVPLMFPFHLISECSRTLALAVRLFGNMMSGEMILAILLAISPLFFPVVMTALGLLTGIVQAYIFGILVTVFLAAATSGHSD